MKRVFSLLGLESLNESLKVNQSKQQWKGADGKIFAENKNNGRVSPRVRMRVCRRERECVSEREREVECEFMYVRGNVRERRKRENVS